MSFDTQCYHSLTKQSPVRWGYSHTSLDAGNHVQPCGDFHSHAALPAVAGPWCRVRPLFHGRTLLPSNQSGWYFDWVLKIAFTKRSRKDSRQGCNVYIRPLPPAFLISVFGAENCILMSAVIDIHFAGC